MCDEEEFTYCPACGEVIPEESWPAHEAGADRRRIDCPAQDLAAVRARAQDLHGNPIMRQW